MPRMSLVEHLDERLTQCLLVVRCCVAGESCRCSDCSDPVVHVVFEWIEERVQKIPSLLLTRISLPEDVQCRCDREHDQACLLVDRWREFQVREGTDRTESLPSHFLGTDIVQLIVDLSRGDFSPVFLLVSRHMFCYFAYHDSDYLKTISFESDRK